MLRTTMSAGLTMAVVFNVVFNVAFTRAAEPLPSFEVASIKPAAPQTPGRMMRGMRGGPGTSDPGQMNFMNVSLKDLIQNAYSVRDYQVVGPSWLESARFDITAKMPGNTTSQESKLMLQNLLADRFKLTLHHATKDMPVYMLVVAKNGPKLKESVDDGKAGPEPGIPQGGGNIATGGPVGRDKGGPIGKDGFPQLPPGAMKGGARMMIGNGRMKMMADGQPMDRLVDMLAMQVDRPIIDMTGLRGKYDINLEFAPDMALMQSKMGGLPPGGMPPGGGLDANAPDAQSVPGIFTALQEQLGLRLEDRKGPVDLLVIDNAAKAPTEN